MAGDKESKTEKPTAQKLKKARDEGQIARSQDLVGWGTIYATFTILQMTVKRTSALLNRSMAEMADLIAHPDIHNGLSYAVRTIRDGFVAVAPLMLGFMVIAIIGHLAQVRLVLALKSIKPSFSKINPLHGIKKLFSMQSIFQAAKQAVTATILGYVAYRTLYVTMTSLAQNGPYPVGVLVHVTVTAVVSFIKKAAFAGTVIGLIDYLYQKRKIGKSLMMTKQEVKEESKSQDLSPEIRGKIRQKQRQMSRNRMMAAVKDADVVVVNPVHIAVALKYDPIKGAPKVVAKGAGFVAEKIRERADESKVPLIQDVPLARTLHHACDIDDEIPAELFEGVARLLAFVFALRSRGTSAGFHKMPGTPDVEEADRLEARTRALATS